MSWIRLAMQKQRLLSPSKQGSLLQFTWGIYQWSFSSFLKDIQSIFIPISRSSPSEVKKSCFEIFHKVDRIAPVKMQVFGKVAGLRKVLSNKAADLQTLKTGLFHMGFSVNWTVMSKTVVKISFYITAMVSCSRFIWITNSSDHRRVWTPNLLHTK